MGSFMKLCTMKLRDDPLTALRAALQWHVVTSSRYCSTAVTCSPVTLTASCGYADTRIQRHNIGRCYLERGLLPQHSHCSSVVSPPAGYPPRAQLCKVWRWMVLQLGAAAGAGLGNSGHATLISSALIIVSRGNSWANQPPCSCSSRLDYHLRL